MKALKVLPQRSPKLVDIDQSLESLQHEVDGYIQVIYPFEDKVAIVCDDEGKINGKEPNRVLQDEDGKVYDVLCGTFLIVGLSDDDFTDLSLELIDKYINKYESPEYFVRTSSGIAVLRDSEMFFI